MSYEGYEEYMCEDGHYWAEDALYSLDISEFDCPDCKKKAIWNNPVDQTNDDGEQYRAKLIEKTPAVYETCNLGHQHLKTAATYFIPEDKGNRMDK
jgi:hypothetical protein